MSLPHEAQVHESPHLQSALDEHEHDVTLLGFARDSVQWEVETMPQSGPEETGWDRAQRTRCQSCSRQGTGATAGYTYPSESLATHEQADDDDEA